MPVAVIYSYEKGASPAMGITATVIDSAHNAVDARIHGTVSTQSADVLDYNDDPSGDASWTSITGIVLPGPSGPVAGGTASNPIRVDPTGTTTQPVSIAADVTVQSSRAAKISDPSRIAITTADTQAFAANTKRIVATLTNESSGKVYVLKGSGVASSTNYDYVLDGGGGSIPISGSEWDGEIRFCGETNDSKYLQCGETSWVA